MGVPLFHTKIPGRVSSLLWQVHMEAAVWRGALTTGRTTAFLSPPSLGPVVSFASARLHRPAKGSLPPGLQLQAQAPEDGGTGDSKERCLVANVRGVAALVMDYGAVRTEAVCDAATGGCKLHVDAEKKTAGAAFAAL